MSSFRAGEGLEKYLAHRRLWLQVIFGAMALGTLINLFASSISEYLQQKWPAGPWGLGWLGFWSIALLVLILVILIYLLRRDFTEASGLTLVLPLRVDQINGLTEILHHRKYLPAWYGRQRLAQAAQGFHRQFAQQWPGPNPLKNKNFAPGHYCWEAIRSLVEAIVVKCLHEYGEHTLGPNASFHGEFRRLAAAALPAGVLEVTQGPLSWQQNPFLASGGPLKVLLLRSSQVSSDHTPFSPKEPPGRRNLVIATPLARFTISISPFWTILRDRQTAEAVFGSHQSKEAVFLVIPVELRLVLKGVFFLTNKMTNEYLWFQKLLENARRRLSYGDLLRSGMED